MLFDLLDGLAGDAAVERDKIHAILRMQANDIDEILCRERCKVALIVNHAVIHGNRADHGRTFTGQFAAERLGVAVAGQIHDCLRAHIYRSHDLLHFDIVILAVTGHAEIDVDLGAKHGTHTVRFDAGMQLIGADRDLSFGNKVTDFFLGSVFLCGDCFHFGCDDTASCGVHLCCVVSHNLGSFQSDIVFFSIFCVQAKIVKQRT